MLKISNANQCYDKQNWRFWLKDGRTTTTTVILASRAAPPQAVGSQKDRDEKRDFKYCHFSWSPLLIVAAYQNKPTLPKMVWFWAQPEPFTHISCNAKEL